jgi:hypothetical protein
MTTLKLRETDEGTELGCTVFLDPQGKRCVVLDEDELLEIVEAVQDVVDSWEHGDLAGAVNNLRITFEIPNPADEEDDQSDVEPEIRE